MQVYNFQNCYEQTHKIITSMQKKQELLMEEPVLYKSWLVNYSGFRKNWNNGLLSDFFTLSDKEASDYFGFIQKNKVDETEHDYFADEHKQKLSLINHNTEFAQLARNDLIRCLAVAIKCHFFLFGKDTLAEPPSIIQFPDLINLNAPRFGLIYPFLGAKHALIVSKVDLSAISSSSINLMKFPVILSSNPNKWLNATYWKRLAKDGEELATLIKHGKEKLSSWRDKKTFPFGVPLDIPDDNLSDMRGTGIRWSDGIKSWYLPKGYDLPPIQEYLSFLKERNKKTLLTWDL